MSRLWVGSVLSPERIIYLLVGGLDYEYCLKNMEEAHTLILRPIARRKFSIRISVFLTSDEYTSDPTMGQNGTCSAAARLTTMIV